MEKTYFITSESLQFSTVERADDSDIIRALNLINPIAELPDDDIIVYINADYDKDLNVPENAYAIKIEKLLGNTFNVTQENIKDISAKSGYYLIFIGGKNISYAEEFFVIGSELKINKPNLLSSEFHGPALIVKDEFLDLRIGIANYEFLYGDIGIQEGIYISDFRSGEPVSAKKGMVFKEIVVIENIIAYIGEVNENVYMPGKNGYIVTFIGEDKIKETDGFSVGDKVVSHLAECNVLPANGLSFNDTALEITGFNTPRNAESLIIYTPDFYSNTTQTNIWGTEIIVEDGVVTEVIPWADEENSGNSPIPKKGYVISFTHDNKHFDKLKSIRVGDEIELYTDTSGYDITKIVYTGKDTHKPGENVLITSDYLSKTRTTHYGFDILVDKDNKVVLQSSDGESEVPEGGFAVSCDNKTMLEMYKKDLIGNLSYIDEKNNTVYFFSTPMQKTEKYINIFETLKTKADESLESLLDLDYASITESITEISKLLNEANNAEDKAIAFTKNAEAVEKIKELSYFLTESNKVEDRGAWHILSEKTDDQVRKTIESATELNLNYLIIDAWSNGYVFHNTELEGIHKNPTFGDFDPIESFVRIGKELDMDIHVSMSSLISGNVNLEYPENHISKNEEWRVKSQKGTDYSISNDGKYYTLNPHNPQVREKLIGIATELAEKYDITGFHYDYTRFQQPHPTTGDFGYNDDIVEAFQKKHKTNKEPSQLSTSDPLWMDWCQFRCDIISDFVEECSSAVRSVNDDIIISAAVFAGLDEMKTSIFQDSRTWVNRGAIDILMPMNYSYSYKWFSHYTDRAVDVIGESGKLLSMGIGVFEFYLPEIIIDEMSLARKTGDGACHFILASLTEDYYKDLFVKGLYRKKAVSAYSLRAFDELKKDLLDKIDRLYIPNSADNKDVLEDISEKITSVDKSNIEELIEFAEDNLTGAAKDRVSEALVKMKRYMK